MFVYTWCHYENFGQGGKMEGVIKSIPEERGCIFLEKGCWILLLLKTTNLCMRQTTSLEGQRTASRFFWSLGEEEHLV